MRFNPSPPTHQLSGLFPASREQPSYEHHHVTQASNNHHESYPRQNGQHNTVKEGLRHAIHARRALSHNPVINPEDLAPKEVVFQLTPEEEDKRRMRREKNKIAASKCRNKKRDIVKTTRQQYDAFNHDNSQLESEISMLKKEKRMLLQTLNSHDCVIDRARGAARAPSSASNMFPKTELVSPDMHPFGGHRKGFNLGFNSR